jgi:hypothetical protein
MPVVPRPGENNFKPVPPGNHIAVCYRVIDLGTQEGEYMGKKNRRHKILISWEIPDEKMDDGRPFTIGQRFTWSMDEKANLRKVLESWRGKAFVDEDFGANGFDIKNVIGVGCMLNVVHETKSGKLYANIASVAKLPRGMGAPAPTNKRSFVWLSHEEFVESNFDELSDGLKDVVRASPEFKDLAHPERIATEGEPAGPRDDVPFLDDEIPF